MTEQPRVAICQNSIIRGGRLQVILGMVRVLNDMGITPDIITFKLHFDPKTIEALYGQKVQFNVVRMPLGRVWYRVFKRSQEDFQILEFNYLLRQYQDKYDLLISTSNSLGFLPRDAKVLTYMFYPRKGRVMVDETNIAMPAEVPERWSRIWWRKRFLRQIYRWVRPHHNHRIICMTQFTCSVLHDYYDLPKDLPLIYPHVDLAEYGSKNRDRKLAIVTIGRFGPAKRQLEQVKLAEQIPDIQFHICGFANDGDPYFAQCERYLDQHPLITNVELHRSAPLDEIKRLLQQSKYFLHTMIKEPFGLTAVQALASGCIPIVHNSGGQRESVFIPELRYDDLSEVPAIIQRVEAMTTVESDDMVARLQENAYTNYDEAVFHQRMKALLQQVLETA